MFKIICASIAMLAVGAVVVSATDSNFDPNRVNSQPVPGAAEQVYTLTFAGPGDTFTFYVEKAQKAGDLTVETMDCCFVGDMWRVDLNPMDPEDKDAYGIGDGSTSEWTGAATVHPWVRGYVTVSYGSGIDDFPAGMDVKFTYGRETGINITPQF